MKSYVLGQDITSILWKKNWNECWPEMIIAAAFACQTVVQSGILSTSDERIRRTENKNKFCIWIIMTTGCICSWNGFTALPLGNLFLEDCEITMDCVHCSSSSLFLFWWTNLQLSSLWTKGSIRRKLRTVILLFLRLFRLFNLKKQALPLYYRIS